MVRLWARAIHHQRIVRSEAVPLEDDLNAALGELFAKLDLPRPMVLPKHEREWETFQQTTFTRDHFVEAIAYDKIEVERINPDAPKKKNLDPRNG